MSQNQSGKKISLKSVKRSITDTYVENGTYGYWNFFNVHTHNRTEIAYQYILGLIKTEKGKGNMERMEEEITASDYRAYHHFISSSNWDHQDIIDKVALQTSELMEAQKQESGKMTGCIIDESAHLKKGQKSVGVSKQYAGVAGKVENCQVGVYASLVNGERAALVGEKLFLPEKWVNDKSRCRAAGIPEAECIHKSKPALALDIIDRLISKETKFDWVGGDGLYGHTSEFRQGLDKRGLLFVLDVHKDEKVFLEPPTFEVPQPKGRGRKPTQKKPNIEPVRVDEYFKRIDKDKTCWSVEKKIRRGHKGWLKLRIHKVKVWVQEAGKEDVVERTLIMSHKLDGRKEVKYSLSNGGEEEYTHHQYGWFQSQRYWVERTFDDAKNELSLSDYQVRKWKGWHHHHSLVFMAALFLLKHRINFEDEAPLMSMGDARKLMIVGLFGTEEQKKIRVEQMKARHLKRQIDIDRHYQT